MRWTARRKQETLADLDRGLVTEAELLERCGLTPEELEEWRKLYKQGGKAALRTTHLQFFRHRPAGQDKKP